MNTDELQVIEEHMWLVNTIANKFYNHDREDLIQAGRLGISKAYRNFKDNGTTKFSTYAYTFIFGEMHNLVMKAQSIKVSRDLLKLYRQVEKVRYELAQKYGRVVSYEDVALYLEQDVNKVYDAVISAQSIMSLDDDANEINLYEVIPDNNNNDVDLKIQIEDSFKVLNTQEQQIIRSRYYEDLTQSEVARKLNMTQVMVSRYEKKSLEKMRSAML